MSFEDHVVVKRNRPYIYNIILNVHYSQTIASEKPEIALPGAHDFILMGVTKRPYTPRFLSNENNLKEGP